MAGVGPACVWRELVDPLFPGHKLPCWHYSLANDVGHTHMRGERTLNHWIRTPGAHDTGVCNSHALQAVGGPSTCGSLVKWHPIGTIQEATRLYSSRRFPTCGYHNQQATQYHATHWGVPSTWRMSPSPWGVGCKQLLQSHQEAYEYKLGVQTYLLLMLYPLVRLSPPGSRPVAHADSKKVWPAVHGGWLMHWEALAWMAHTLGQPPGPSTLTIPSRNRV